MGKVEEAVRSAIQQAVRRELKDAVTPLSKEVGELQKELRQLEKNVALLRRSGGKLLGSGGALPKLEATDVEVRRARISPAMIKKLRARLGITQAELAAICGVTGPAIAQWEGGTSEPAGENRVTLVALKKLGRQEVERLVDAHGLGSRRRRLNRRRK